MGAFAIAGQFGKDLLRDGEDVSARFVREAIVEDAGLERPGHVALHDQRRRAPAEVVGGLRLAKARVGISVVDSASGDVLASFNADDKFRELRSAGYGSDHILTAATEVIGELGRDIGNSRKTGTVAED